MAECLESDEWVNMQEYTDINNHPDSSSSIEDNLPISIAPTIEVLSPVYKLHAEYKNGETVYYEGIFDRAHLPDVEFMRFINHIQGILKLYEMGELISLSQYKSPVSRHYPNSLLHYSHRRENSP